MRYFILSIVGSVILGACATNQATTATLNEEAETQTVAGEGVDAEGQEVAEVDGEEVVCKKVVVKRSGARRSLRRVCKTNDEWQEVREAEQQRVAEGDEDRVICKRTIVTGSRFAKLVCRTWAEWKAQEEQAADYVGAQQRRSRSTDHEEY